MYGAELHIRSAPHAEIKSEADDRAFFEPDQASKTDALVFVRALDSGGLIRVIRRSILSEFFDAVNDNIRNIQRVLLDP